MRKEIEARQQKQQREIEDVSESRKLLIPQARTLSKAQIAFLACKQKLLEELTVLDVDRYCPSFCCNTAACSFLTPLVFFRQLLSALRAALEKRRWRLISELVEIYPIQPVSGKASGVFQR
jgi:hypothetical protein